MKASVLGTIHLFTSMVPKPSATLHPDIKNGDFWSFRTYKKEIKENV